MDASGWHVKIGKIMLFLESLEFLVAIIASLSSAWDSLSFRSPFFFSYATFLFFPPLSSPAHHQSTSFSSRSCLGTKSIQLSISNHLIFIRN